TTDSSRNEFAPLRSLCASLRYSESGVSRSASASAISGMRLKPSLARDWNSSSVMFRSCTVVRPRRASDKSGALRERSARSSAFRHDDTDRREFAIGASSGVQRTVVLCGYTQAESTDAAKPDDGKTRERSEVKNGCRRRASAYLRRG